MYGLRSKLVCLFVKACVYPSQKALAYYKICPLPVNDKYQMFYSTGGRIEHFGLFYQLSMTEGNV
jgi:hypothetical protein